MAKSEIKTDAGPFHLMIYFTHETTNSTTVLAQTKQAQEALCPIQEEKCTRPRKEGRTEGRKKGRKQRREGGKGRED